MIPKLHNTSSATLGRTLTALKDSKDPIAATLKFCGNPIKHLINGWYELRGLPKPYYVDQLPDKMGSAVQLLSTLAKVVKSRDAKYQVELQLEDAEGRTHWCTVSKTAAGVHIQMESFDKDEAVSEFDFTNEELAGVNKIADKVVEGATQLIKDRCANPLATADLSDPLHESIQVMADSEVFKARFVKVDPKMRVAIPYANLHARIVNDPLVNSFLNNIVTALGYDKNNYNHKMDLYQAMEINMLRNLRANGESQSGKSQTTASVRLISINGSSRLYYLREDLDNVSNRSKVSFWEAGNNRVEAQLICEASGLTFKQISDVGEPETA